MSAIDGAGGGPRSISGGFGAAPGAAEGETGAALRAIIEKRSGVLASAGLRNQGTPAARAGADRVAKLLPSGGRTIVGGTREDGARALDELGKLGPEAWAGCLRELGCGAFSGTQTNPTMPFWQLEGLLLCHPDLMARFVEQAGANVGPLVGAGPLPGDEARLAAQGVLEARFQPPPELPLRDAEAVRRRLLELEVETPASKAAAKAIDRALAGADISPAETGRALDALERLSAPEWLSCLFELGRSRHDGTSSASMPFARLVKGLHADAGAAERFEEQCAKNLGSLIGTGPLRGADARFALDFMAPALRGRQPTAAEYEADRRIREVAGMAASGLANVLEDAWRNPDSTLGKVMQRFGLAPDGKDEKKPDR